MTKLNSVDTKPWFHYSWPWVAIAIIIWTLMSGTGMIYFSTKGDAYSLVDGYNKIGKAAFDNKEWHKKAIALNIKATLIKTQNKFRLRLIPSQQSIDFRNLELKFIHPTNEKRDIIAKMQLEGETIIGEIPEKISGWIIKLRNKDKKWEIYKKFGSPEDFMLELD